MIVFNDKRVRSLVLLSACVLFVSCSKSEVASKSAPADHDSALATQGSIEVTASLSRSRRGRSSSGSCTTTRPC